MGMGRHPWGHHDSRSGRQLALDEATRDSDCRLHGLVQASDFQDRADRARVNLKSQTGANIVSKTGIDMRCDRALRSWAALSIPIVSAITLARAILLRMLCKCAWERSLALSGLQSSVCARWSSFFTSRTRRTVPPRPGHAQKETGRQRTWDRRLHTLRFGEVPVGRSPAPAPGVERS